MAVGESVGMQVAAAGNLGNFQLATGNEPTGRKPSAVGGHWLPLGSKHGVNSFHLKAASCQLDLVSTAVHGTQQFHRHLLGQWLLSVRKQEICSPSNWCWSHTSFERLTVNCQHKTAGK